MAETVPSNRLQVDITNRQILKIALPISFAIFIPQINFITNNIFLGNYSSQALAIAGVTGVYYLLFSAIGFGLNNGLQTLISRRAGENRPEEIGKLFKQGVFIALAIAAIGIIITWTITPYLFSFFIKDDSRLQQAITFSRIRIWGLPFLFIYQMRNALLVGINQSRYLVIGTLAEAITNIVLDYFLIFGKWGFPEMGFNGAAVASIIAEFMGMIVIFMVIYKKGIARQFQLFKNFRWDGYNASLIFSISAPLIFQAAISIMSWEYFFLVIDSHGEMALAISNIMRNVFGLFGVVTWAFAATTSSMVSNIIGQNKREQVWPLIAKIIRISCGFALVAAVLLNLFAEDLLAIYGQSDEFILQATPVIRVVSLAMILMSFSVVFINAVTGTGNSTVSFFIELFTIVVYCIYVYLVLQKYSLSITYGWMSEWLYWTCMFVPALLYMRSGRWKKKVL